MLHYVVRHLGQNRDVTQASALDGIIVANAAFEHDDVVRQTDVKQLQRTLRILSVGWRGREWTAFTWRRRKASSSDFLLGDALGRQISNVVIGFIAVPIDTDDRIILHDPGNGLGIISFAGRWQSGTTEGIVERERRRRGGQRRRRRG